MKKIALILAALMVLGLCACKGSLEVDPNGSASRTLITR